MKIPLRIVSDYSLLKSLISLPKLIPFLVKNNIKVCGICDDNLYGAVEFYLKCMLKIMMGIKIF